MAFDEEKRKRIVEIIAEIEKLQAERDMLTVKLQDGCTHESVLGVESEGTFPSQRICAICGLEEMGLTPTVGSKLVASPVRKVRHFNLRRCRDLPPLKMVLIPELTK